MKTRSELFRGSAVSPIAASLWVLGMAIVFAWRICS